MTGIETHTTYRAALRMPAAQARPEETGRRMRAEIDKLRRDQEQARAANSQSDTEGGIVNVAFRRSEGSDHPVYELNVTGTCADATLAELARLTLALVVRHPISHIAWLQDAALLDRNTFLTALAPKPARPRLSEAAQTARPKKRLCRDTAERARENAVRLEILRPPSETEKASLRAELGLPTPQRRAAVATLAVTSAALALNATSAVAEGLIISGLF